MPFQAVRKKYVARRNELLMADIDLRETSLAEICTGWFRRSLTDFVATL